MRGWYENWDLVVDRKIVQIINLLLDIAWDSLKLASRLTFQILERWVLPWVLRLVSFLIRWMIFTVLSTIRGPRMATDLVADQWTDGVLGVGVPIAFASNLYPLFKFGAYSLLIMGWIVIACIGLAVSWYLLILYGLVN